MNLRYLIPRVIRHFLPESLTRFLLRRSIVIKPGLETSDPRAAVARYEQVLQSNGMGLRDKRILVFGYGGRFDIGVLLLEAGADHVVLCDAYATPDDAHNRELVDLYPSILEVQAGHVMPRSEHLTLLHDDVRAVRATSSVPTPDIVLSTSVFEHVGDVEGTVRALAELMKSGGIQVHYVDLRDHFFKYPFEMLRYSESAWRRWLNPTSNHNRLRIWQLRSIFDKWFGDVRITILQQDDEALLRMRSAIKPEFLSGNLEEDAATLILVVARTPRSKVVS